jgi:regulator of sirC expression with transglutaminase-like and TPR domain
MDPSPGLIRFIETVAREDFPLDYAALLIGAWDYPQRDVDTYREQLDSIASFAAPEVERASSGIGRARAISDCLFERLGFCGNTDDYYDPRNSFLADVLDRRTGIPISLSVLYLEVARRVGVLAQGVNFPGHFLVRVAIEDASVIAAASKRQILSRMLVNLAGIYGRQGDLVRSLDVLERLAVLEPSNPRIVKDLAQLRERVDGLN